MLHARKLGKTSELATSFERESVRMERSYFDRRSSSNLCLCMTSRAEPTSKPPLMEAYLLPMVDYSAVLALQQRLVYELSGREDGRIALLVCEHPPLITIGRAGSHHHLRCGPEELASRKLETRWVNRGGGVLLHAPGQLAIYPIVPLFWYGYSVGAYLDRLQQATTNLLTELRVPPRTCPERYDLWGRNGWLACLGVAIKSWTSYHGIYLNVSAPLNAVNFISNQPLGLASSVNVERQTPVSMSKVREAAIRHIGSVFGNLRTQIYLHHPLLPTASVYSHETARVG